MKKLLLLLLTGALAFCAVSCGKTSPPEEINDWKVCQIAEEQLSAYWEQQAEALGANQFAEDEWLVLTCTVTDDNIAFRTSFLRWEKDAWTVKFDEGNAAGVDFTGESVNTKQNYGALFWEEKSGSKDVYIRCESEKLPDGSGVYERYNTSISGERDIDGAKVFYFMGWNE